jgi:hypothetical protein
MSLEHSPARQARSSAAAVDCTAPSMVAAAFTVDQFCAAHQISRALLYKLWEQKLGPRRFCAGSKVLISFEAAADWRRERERAAEEEAA